MAALIRCVPCNRLMRNSMVLSSWFRYFVRFYKHDNIYYASKRELLLKSSKLPTLFQARFFLISASNYHGEFEMKDPNSEDEVVNITYIDKNGTQFSVKGKVGDNAMYLAHRYNIEIEGACEASLACCTCHVYVEPSYASKLPPPEEMEEDMLDMAPFLKENSRLSCQIILSKELDGIQLELPPATRNFYVDGHVPKPH